MTDLFKPFNKIGQYRHAVKEMTYLFTEKNIKKLTFTGTVKLHGTNAAIQYSAKKGSIYFQSRNNLIEPLNDNAGFATWANSFRDHFTDYLISVGYSKDVILYGEWCGGNIQKNVAIAELPKMFVIFSCKIDGIKTSLLDLPAIGIENVFFVTDFMKYKQEISLDTMSTVSNTLASITEAVEAECPVAKALGVSGIGEGIVWSCDEYPDNSDLIFKVKGEKHSVSKVKTLVPVDPVKLENVQKFVEYAATENRMNQGIEIIGLNESTIGKFIGWVNKDIYEEEKDVLEANCLTMKDVGKQLTNKARQFYISKL